MDNRINDYVIKLSGKASIPEPLRLGTSYKVVLDGAVTTTTEADNHDGTMSVYFKFEPILAEIVKENGEIIKAKDVRSNAQRCRSAIWKQWSLSNSNIEFDDYYAEVMARIIKAVIEGQFT